MTATAKGKGQREAKPWWSQRGNRNKVWLALLGVLAVVAIVAVFVSRRDGDEASAPSSRFSSTYTFQTDDLHAITFDAARPDRLVFGHHGGVLSSEDAGQTWKTLVDRPNFDGMNLVFDPQSPETLYLAGHNVLSRSDDAGKTWQPFSADLPGLDLHAFAASQRQPGRFYAFAAGKGLFMSDGGPSSWRQIAAGAPPGTNSIVELDDNALLLGAGDKGILRSEDGGKTWRDSRAGIDSGVIFSVKGDGEGKKLYAGTSKGVYASTDGGRNWSPTALNDTIIVVVGVHPANADQVVAIGRDGKLFHSQDGGASWGG